MMRLTWWTCTLALLAITDARIYGRCELARDLTAYGVRDRISTWVCIAYYESQFNTAEHNMITGDYGIFQISEHYWCGPGKGCGLNCSALLDDDIRDDVQCALTVYKENMRWLGNGFDAWTTYTLYCRGDTKIFIADCDQ